MGNGQVPGVGGCRRYVYLKRPDLHELFCKGRPFGRHVEIYVLDRSSTSIYLIYEVFSYSKTQKTLPRCM